MTNLVITLMRVSDLFLSLPFLALADLSLMWCLLTCLRTTVATVTAISAA